MPPYDGRLSGRVVCPLRQGVASSETEMIRPVRGLVRCPRARRRRFASPRVGSLPSSEAETRGAIEGLDGEPSSETEITPGSEGVRMGRVLGFFEFFPFFQIGRRP